MRQGQASKEVGHIEFLSSALTQVAIIHIMLSSKHSVAWGVESLLLFHFPCPCSFNSKESAFSDAYLPLPLPSTSWNDLVGHQGPAYIVLSRTVHHLCAFTSPYMMSGPTFLKCTFYTPFQFLVLRLLRFSGFHGCLMPRPLLHTKHTGPKVS